MTKMGNSCQQNKVSLKDIHSKILELAIYFDKFCKENNIVYYLMGGSALGAIRHKGFIPWDDDLDVFMEYDQYQKFLRIAKEKLDSNYYLQKENTDEWPGLFSKLRMNNTTFIEEGYEMPSGSHQGFFIDIMCLYNTPSNTILRYIQYTIARIVIVKSQYKKKYKTSNIIKRIIMSMAGILISDKTQKKLLKMVSYWQRSDTKYVGHFFGRAPFSKTSFPRIWLGKQRYVNFENCMLPVPSSAEQYLRLRYGENYMEMPNKKTIAAYPSHAKIVDPNRNYTEYL